MKNDKIHFVLICLAYFSIGLILSNMYVTHKRLVQHEQTLGRILLLQMITETQIKILGEQIKLLERNHLVSK